jgi:hypothetical protein
MDLLFDLSGLVCFENKHKIVGSHTADSKPVKQEVNSTVVLPPLVFPVWGQCYENTAVNYRSIDISWDQNYAVNYCGIKVCHQVLML